MMRLSPGILVALLLTACSSGTGEDAGLSAKQIRALTCVRVSTVDLIRLLDRVEAVLLTALGDPEDGVTLLPSADAGDQAHTFTFAVEFDGDNDRIDDTRLTGKITFPQDPASGIPGAVDLPFRYTLAPLGAVGPLQADGSATLRFESGTQALLTGTGTFGNRDTGCGGAFGFDTAAGVRVAFSKTIATASQLTADILGLKLWGTLGVDLTSAQGDRFVGTVELGAATRNATADGVLDGSEFTHVFSIYPDAEATQELIDCIEAIVPVYADMTGVFLALSQVIDAAGGDLASVPATPGFTIELTSNASIANYALDLTRFGVLLDGGRIDGQVRVSRVGFRIAVLWSWRLNGRIGSEVVTGQSALFFRVQYAGDGTVTSLGAGTLGRDGCIGAFEIPEEDPLVQPYAGGSIMFGGSTGIHTIDAEFAVGLGGGASRRVRIDDIPAPLTMVIGFAGRG